MLDELTGIDRDKLINYDISGWPVYKMNLREILNILGAVECGNDFIGFDANDPILDTYPLRLEDDGMNYGINPQYIISVDTDRRTFITLFTETALNNKVLDEWVKNQYKLVKKIKESYDNR